MCLHVLIFYFEWLNVTTSASTLYVRIPCVFSSSPVPLLSCVGCVCPVSIFPRCVRLLEDGRELCSAELESPPAINQHLLTSSIEAWSMHKLPDRPHTPSGAVPFSCSFVLLASQPVCPAVWFVSILLLDFATRLPCLIINWLWFYHFHVICVQTCASGLKKTVIYTSIMVQTY